MRRPSVAQVVATGAGVFGLLAIFKRRRRPDQPADEAHQPVAPVQTEPKPEPAHERESEVMAGDGHAPGHRHLGPPPDDRRPLQERSKHQKEYFAGDRVRLSRS